MFDVLLWGKLSWRWTGSCGICSSINDFCAGGLGPGISWWNQKELILPRRALVLMGKSLPEMSPFHMDKREIGFPLWGRRRERDKFVSVF